MVQAANGDLSFVHWSRPSFSIGLSELICMFFFGCRLPQPSKTLFLTTIGRLQSGSETGRRQREHFIDSKGFLYYKENQSNKKFFG